MCCWINLYLLFVGLGSISLVVGNVEIDGDIAFFHGSTYDESQMYELSEAGKILEHPKFDGNRTTLFYMHGYNESVRARSVQWIVNAYIQRGSHNILTLDWSTLVGGTYPLAVNNLNELAPKVAYTFLDLFERGLDSSKLHLVGHSLGAHLAGQISSTITHTSDGEIRLHRITGLDPAFPQYYPPIGSARTINRNDADLVDIIHTDASGYGAPFQTGTVDFWVNGGVRIQPGCPVGIFMPLTDNDLCSHLRAVSYWAESVSNPDSKFYATDFKTRTKIQMGIDCPMDSRGSYALTTYSTSPFSKPH